MTTEEMRERAAEITQKQETIARVLDPPAWRWYDCLISCGKNQHGMSGNDFPQSYSLSYGKYGCRTENDFRRYCLIDADPFIDSMAWRFRRTLEISDDIIYKLAVIPITPDPSAEALKLAKEAFVHIEEYWNGSRTDGAMYDALYVIVETASAALAGIRKITGGEK